MNVHHPKKEEMDLGGPVSEHSSGEERRKDEMGRRVLIRKPTPLIYIYIYIYVSVDYWVGLYFILFAVWRSLELGYAHIGAR